jgi:Leucine-rich repeat (LRR) protein
MRTEIEDHAAVIHSDGTTFDIPRSFDHIQKFTFWYKGKPDITNISNLMNVEEIHLEDCPHNYCLPAGIEDLPKLKHLECNAGFARRAFLSLQLSPPACEKPVFPSLQSLDINGCGVECDITGVFNYAPLLEELLISGKEGKYTPVPKGLLSLDLKKLRLEYIDLDTIYNYPNLEDLSIGYSQPHYEDVTRSMTLLYRKFPRLRELTLSWCKFKNNALPVELTFLQNMETLFFDTVYIKSFPKESGLFKSLKTLEIYNQFFIFYSTIKKFPENLTLIPNLETLAFLQPVETIPVSLKNMKSLRVLDLSSTFPIHIKPPEFLSEMIWLTELKVGNHKTTSNALNISWQDFPVHAKRPWY